MRLWSQTVVQDKHKREGLLDSLVDKLGAATGHHVYRRRSLSY